MKTSHLLLCLVCILVTATCAFAVFPSRKAVGRGGEVIPYGRFIEEPRMIDGRRYLPGPSETIVVILVEFPEDTVDVDTTVIADTCAAVTFQTGHDSTYYRQKIFSENAGSNSMDKYWDECSLGQMDITGRVYGPYTVPHCMKYYGWDNDSCVSGTLIDDGWSDDGGNPDCLKCQAGGGGTGTCRLIKDAVEAADTDIDYCEYDTDGDGSVDHVMVVHAGKGQELGSSVPGYNIWSWFYGNLAYGPYDTLNCAEGALVASGFICPEFYVEPDSFPLGVFCHEFSHSIGNPDLYSPQAGYADVPDNNDYPVADWCLMAHGSWCGPTGTSERPSHLLGFNKVGTGWVNPTVLTPQKDTTTYAVGELETAGASIYKIDISRGEYFLVENRNPQSQNTDFDKHDSDWSDWTGQGGPDSLDCGLIITHIMGVHGVNLMNKGRCSYDYVYIDEDSCSCQGYPYEVWVEDPGYNDSLTTDYDEWWYPWEMKAGAALANDDPHTVFDTLWYWNDNCTRTASSIDNSGNVTGIYVKPLSGCGSSINASVFIPGWTLTPKIARIEGFCSEWAFFHHDRHSQGWTHFAPVPDVGVSYADRLKLAWSGPGATAARSSPVATNTRMTVPPGEVVEGLTFVAATSGTVYCYVTEDGGQVWATEVEPDLHTTPIACDTLRGAGGSELVLGSVYVNGMSPVLFRLDLSGGAILDFWTEPTGNPLEADPRIALVEDPGPGADVPLIFVGSMGGFMYAVNAQTMTARWDYPATGPINCPAAMGEVPLPFVGGEDTQTIEVEAVFFGDASGRLHCVEALGGMPLWDVDLGMEIVASPAVCDSVSQGIAGCSDQVVLVATVEGKIFARDAATGFGIWQFNAGDPIVSSPSVAVDGVHDWGMVWFQTTGGTTYCLHLGDPPDGNRVIWSHTSPGGTGSTPGVVLPYGMLPLGSDGEGNPVYPPACATGDPEQDGVVYIGSADGGGGGRLLGLDAADGTLLWHYDLPAPVEASPAPTSGTVLVSEDRLYAFRPDTLASVESAEEGVGRLRLVLGPNPVSHSTDIECHIPAKTLVTLRIYTVRGRLVRSLLEETKEPGVYSLRWDGISSNGRPVADGIYFARLHAGRHHITQKLILIR